MITSRTRTTLAALPGVLMLGAFYSLAIHMHWTLGGWPTGLGERGFPPALVIHSTISMIVFIVVLESGLLVAPVVTLACLLVPRWQRFFDYVVVHLLVVIVCFGITQFAAPAPFLYWWRD